MIAALDMLQTITDKPDWMLREEEMALREKMHNDELEMSLMMTQIKNEQDRVDFLDGQIADHQSTLIQVRSDIKATGANLDKLPDYEKTDSGQGTPDSIYEDIEDKYKEPLQRLERDKRDRQEILNELKHKVKLRGDELGDEVGKLSIKKEADATRRLANEDKRLIMAEQTAKEVQKIREAQEERAGGKYAGTDPASIQEQMNLAYAGIQSLTVEDGALDASSIEELAEASGGIYAENAALISTTLTQLFASSNTGEGFLTALAGENRMYKDFLMQDGMVLTKNNLSNLLLLSLSDTAADSVTNPQQIIQMNRKKLPPFPTINIKR